MERICQKQTKQKNAVLMLVNQLLQMHFWLMMSSYSAPACV